MRDPQMWANKMLSNALHIANTTAKGGIIAEKNAFDNQVQAEESYARPALASSQMGGLARANTSLCVRPSTSWRQSGS